MSESDRVGDLLLHWDDLRERGTPISAEELCRDCPDLLDEVRGRVRAMEAIYRLANGVDNGATATESATVAAVSAQLPQVAGYEMLGVLGSGGMGTVYKARHIGLNRLVALKMIARGAHASRSEMARMRAEAEAIARLQHPNVVQIHEVGEHEGLPFLTLEYVDGGSLADHLESRRWPFGTPEAARQAAQVVETLARAMHVAHQQGIIHRDLKPANVLLQKDEGGRRKEEERSSPAAHSSFSLHPSTLFPKITDFGLAKRLDAEARLTQTGAVMGTPSYMAPEQAEGKVSAFGPQTDVYALGAILYELLTGQPPFQGATLLETLEQVRSHEPRRPSALQPKLPRDLDTICLKCLEKEPSHRYASALELADDLKRFQDGELIHARAFTLMDRVVRSLHREQNVVHFYALGKFLMALAPLPFVTHLIGFVLIRRGWPHAVGLWATLADVCVAVPFLAWASLSGRLRIGGQALRDFWSNRIGALSGMVLLALLGYLLSSPDHPWEPLTVFPYWALLTGVTVFGMGSSFTGRFYVYGVFLVALAFVMVIDLEWAVLEFGTAVSAIFAAIAFRLRRISLERELTENSSKSQQS